MEKIFFAIGHYKNGFDEDAEDNETESVFTSKSLVEVIKEFQNKKYTEPNYFIDVWEKDEDGLSYPVADIKIQNWIF